MSHRLSDFLDTVSTWSRAMQWAFWAAVLTVAFLVWDSTVAEIGANWSAKADSIESQIAEINRPNNLTSSVKKTIRSFGDVELPREKSNGATAMTDAVHAILKSNAVRNDEYTRTKSSKMRSGSLPGIAGAGKVIEQVIGDIRFEATQENVLKVISQLESSPWIDAVSDVRLAKQDGRMIRVDLAVEAWVVASSTRRGGR
ncbi:MAG: hypothetical protein MK073_05970 [Phycisphaerales bacterium]|nr:hypothetical protein [Phycisphaerales bacterium]